MKHATQRRWAALTCLLSAWLAFSSPACSSGDDSDGDGDARDAAGEGLTLTDIDPREERWEVAPTSVTFDELEIGDVDFRTVVVTNASVSPQAITRIALLDTDPTVRFANTFLQRLGDGFRWADLDGNGHDFEVREQPIELGPRDGLEVLIQYRPDGGLSQCLDPAPAPCGHLVVGGAVQSVSVPLFIPR